MLRKSIVGVFILCGTLAGPTTIAAAETKATAEATEVQEVEFAQLSLVMDGRQIGLLVQIGGSAEIVDHGRNRKWRLEASIQPGAQNQSGKRQVALLILESAAARGAEATLLDLLLLSEQDDSVTRPHLPLEVRLEEVLQLDLSRESTSNWDIGECCLGCKGVLICGACVTTSCGSCCAF